ncbi:MAG: L,D-transpeptidase [Polyangiaceae bacterium]|nr:L,D-transpeptidase [Polyangiaceae bacterium]
MLLFDPRGRARVGASIALIAALSQAADGGAASPPGGGVPGAGASRAPPWVAAGDEPLPAGIRSARVIKEDQPLLDAPSGAARRRGSADRNAMLPIYAALRGEGCDARWLQVGPTAWVCGDAVELSAAGALDPRARTWRETADGLPLQYFFVGPDGSLGYKRIESADVEEPDVQLEPGFAVAIVEERVEGGTRYGRTHRGYWIPMRDLGPVHGFAFAGADVPEGAAEIPFAWVVADKARLHARSGAGGFTPTADSKARFERLPVLEEAQSVTGGFVRVADAARPGDGVWLSLRDVRRPVVAPPPPEVDAGAGERWIDVDLATQTLVAYEGRRPAFATIVSTGKGRKGSPTATPPGTYRTWIKLLTSDMDNLEDESAARYYRIEDVPYVQYFSKGVGLHGAFWHRSFGRVRSHGCVNLSPLDAQRLFWWTSPRLPAGWTAVVPTAHEPGTVVRVR